MERSAADNRTRRRRRLRPRLEKALEMTPGCAVLADVGCDHGQFSLAALESGRAERVIASDISEASLQKAMRLFCGAGYDIEFRCCAGLSGCSQGEADCCALLGMGGELIASILESDIIKARAFRLIVMQPMRGEAELRRWLHENGFAIADEAVVRDDGRFYQLISARYAPDEVRPLPEWWPEGFFQFGVTAIEKHESAMLPMMERYLSMMEKKLNKAAEKGAVPPLLQSERDSTLALIRRYKETIS